MYILLPEPSSGSRVQIYFLLLRWLPETADMDVHATERPEIVTKLSHKLNENESRPWNLSVLRSPV